MTTTRLVLPEELGDVFTPIEAARLGISAGRLDRHPFVRRPFSGVRIRLAPPAEDEPPWETWERVTRLLAKAYARVMPAHAFISHTTALPVLGLPRTRWRASDVPVPVDIEASVLAPERALRASHVSAHQLRPALVRVTARDGIRVADPVSVWAMLGARLTVHELVALGDAIVRIPRVPPRPLERSGPPLGTLAQLTADAEAGLRSGVANLRAALPLIRQGSSSPAETEQRLLMVEAGLPEPTLDHDVYSENGTLLGCSEIVYAGLRLAIECEGDQHRTSRAQWDRDIQKYQAYAEAGWSVMRATDRLIYRDRVENVRRIRALMARAGWRPGQSV